MRAAGHEARSGSVAADRRSNVKLATDDEEAMMHSVWIRTAAAAVLVAFATLATADITLYQREGYGGRRFTATQSVSDLANVGFNDRASSVVIHGGSWQLCSDAYFRGRCVTLSSGDYPSLSSMGLNDTVSSIRDLGWTTGTRPPPVPPTAQGGQSRIVLYGQPNLSGRSVTLDAPVVNFEGIGFNDSARSAVVYGGNWQLCTEAQFQGDCEVVRPGQWNNLGGVSARVSSARPLGGGGGGPPVASWGNGSRAILYEGHELSGRAFVVDRDVVSNLDRTDFNDRARSLRIEGGYWVFCSDAQFQGECLTFGPGDYPNLPRELDGRISSGRRISNAYPYNQPPSWSR